MHIVQVISSNLGGGAERLAAGIHAALKANGLESTLIYLTNPLGVELGEGEEWLGFSNPRDPRCILALRGRIKRILSNNSTVAVHAHLTHSLYFTPMACAGLNVKTIYTEHSTHNSRRRWRLYRYIERLIYRRYTKIVAISRGVRDNLAVWLGLNADTEKIALIYNGARQFPVSQRHYAPPPKLLSIGSLTVHKGFDVALEAVALLGDEYDTYTIVGRGPMRASLQAQARRLGIESKVSFVGWSDAIGEYLAVSDIVMVPSRWEGFGLVAVEAMSSGLPLICSDVPGLNEIGENCAAVRLCKASDPVAFADAVRATSKELLGENKISEIACRRASEFGLDAMLRKYIALYRELFGEIVRESTRLPV